MESGELTKVRFIKHTIPSDIADLYDAGGPVEGNGHIELTVVAGRGWRIPLKNPIRNVLGGSKNVREMVELQNFEYDNVKVELDVAGSRRTLDLSNIMKIKAHYDITEELQVGSNGHPIFDSIDGIARNLMDDLLENLGGQDSDV